jgi:ubiquinone/menaquinone biosynthesis C-methylase UbiE
LGCSESTNAIEMASLGFQVVGVDGRPLPLRHPNFTIIQSQLDELPLEDETFDSTVALSTTGCRDRAGLTSEQREAAVVQTVAEVFRVLKRGGRFVLTVPFGSRDCAPSQSLYDRAQLDRVLHAFRVVERAYGIREGDAWSFTLDQQRAEEADSSDRVSAVCLLVLEKQ